MFDILVIGAGPAGCATAISCARAGWHVGIIERAEFPRDKPGETLHPGIEPLLQQLGVAAAVNAAGFRRHSGYWLQRNRAPVHFESYGRDANGVWLGYQAERSILDSLLLQEAQKAGATVLQSCQALRTLQAPNGRVTGVLTSLGLLTARIIVDASGPQHWLARQLNLPIVYHSPPMRVHYGYLHQKQNEDAAPRFEIGPAGWRWTAPVSNCRLAWVTLSHNTEARPSLSNCMGADFDLSNATPIGVPVRGQEVTWRVVSQAAGSGYILAGDAVGLLDPAAGRGVLKALMSGIMVARVAGQMIRDEDSLFPGQQYCAWLSAWFRHDVQHLRQLYNNINF